MRIAIFAAAFACSVLVLGCSRPDQREVAEPGTGAEPARPGAVPLAEVEDKSGEPQQVPPQGWKLVTLGLGGCSAFLPGTPERQGSNSPDGEVWLGSGDTVFSFGCRRDDDLADDAKAKKELAEEGRLEARVSKGVVADEKKITVKGGVGKDFRIIDKGTKKPQWRQRVYVIGKHMVTLSASGDAGEKEVNIFFDSFRLPNK
jgi:hypothetical protein